MFRIAVCDDNLNETKIVLELLTKFQASHPGIEFHVQGFDSGKKLLTHIKSGKIYDLFLLDILMPDINGIELVKKLRMLNPDVTVIFLTSSTDYALHAYEVSAVQYILKPVIQNKLFDVLDKILTMRKMEKDQFFILSTTEGILKISFSTIVYIEITGHIMRVCLDNGDILSSKSIKVPFKTAVDTLLADSRFLYAHKSYVINMEHVQELIGKSFIMMGGHIIPIPKYKIAIAKEKYFTYLSQCGISCMGGKK